MITFITLILVALIGLCLLRWIKPSPVRLDHPRGIGHRVQMRKTRRGWEAFGALFGLNIGTRIHRLANTAPSLTVTPYDPNGEVHKGSRLSFLADAAITVRWSLVAVGASPGKTVKSNLAATTPFGVIDDTTDTLNNDLTIPIHVRALSGTGETLKVAVNSTVAVGDWLIPDTTNPIYGMTDPGLNFNRFGRAVTAGVAGGLVEFSPCLPTRVAGGIYTSAVAAEADAIVVPGLLATDAVLVNLAAVGGSEKITTAIAAAGQINIVTSANTTSGTTKYNWAASRA